MDAAIPQRNKFHPLLYAVEYYTVAVRNFDALLLLLKCQGSDFKWGLYIDRGGTFRAFWVTWCDGTIHWKLA